MARMDVPADITLALAADRKAGRGFARLAPSHVRAYLNWIGEAKKGETRRQRVAGMVQRLKGLRTQRGNGEG
jgi:uncharacterized protein YdeI (YjbR/CyaY-like superfamily)